MISPETLAEYERLAQAATPEPWPKDYARTDYPHEGTMACGPVITRDDCDDEDIQAQADQDFIADARCRELEAALTSAAAGRPSLPPGTSK